MIEYERLLEIAKKLHLWIFFNADNEYEVYESLGLTDEENKALGYSGQFIIKEKE